MNVNPLIKSALSSLNIPIYPNISTKKEAEYITFNYADERPYFYADDTDLYDITTIQVHLFTKKNPQQYKKDIRKLLKQNGFTILSTMEFYESDTDKNHIVVECEISGLIDD